jgi:hypothetical protein
MELLIAFEEKVQNDYMSILTLGKITSQSTTRHMEPSHTHSKTLNGHLKQQQI